MSRLFLLLLLVCQVPELMAQPVRTQRVLLVFGLNHFADVGHFNGLEYAARDAVRVFDTFTQPTLGQFNRAFVFVREDELYPLAQEADLRPAVRCLLDPRACAPGMQVERYDPTTAAVKQVLQKLRPTRGRGPELLLKPGDMIVAYIASHGTILTPTAPFQEILPEHTAFITSDTRVFSDSMGMKLSGHLTERDILDALDATNATHRLLIEATCHSDLGLRTRGTPRTLGLENVRRTLVIADSSPGQSSVELSSLRASVFTDAFLEALRAPAEHDMDPQGMALYDPNLDGAITVEEAYAWAAEVTYQRTCTQGTSPCQLPAFRDRSFFRRTPFLLSGALDQPLELQAVAAATLIRRSALGERGQKRGSLSLNGVPLEALSARGTEARAHPVPRGLYRLKESGGRSTLLWIPPGEPFAEELLEERLEGQLLWGLGTGAGVGWGHPGGAILEGQLRRTLLTTPRGSTRLELGVKPGVVFGPGCAAVEGSCMPVLTAWRWQVGLDAWVQGQQQLPSRRPVSIFLGGSVSPTYLHLYDEVQYRSGALSKLFVAGGAHTGLEWTVDRRGRSHSGQGRRKVLRPSRLQLAVTFQSFKGALHPEEFAQQVSHWHTQVRTQLTWLHPL